MSATGGFIFPKLCLYGSFLCCAVETGIPSADMTGIALIAAMVFGAAVGALVMLREKIRADTRLRNAIAALPAGIAFFDRNDRLYLWNGAYADVSGSAARLLRRGVQFRELLWAQLDDAHYAEAAGREAQWIEERLTLRAKGEG